MLPKTCPVCKRKGLTFNQDYITCDKCKVYQKRLNFFQKPLFWASQRTWWWRVPLLAWFVFMLIQNLDDPSFALNRMSNPFSALDLGVHELGHMIFSVFNDFMHILGGSLFQILFPILWLLAFWHQRWYFASALCWCWLGLNLFDVASYVADANSRVLPLATGIAGLYEQGSEEAYDMAHDWYQLLSRTGNLHLDLTIARGLRTAAVVVFFIGFSIAGILLLQMVLSQIQRAKTKAATRALTKSS